MNQLGADYLTSLQLTILMPPIYMCLSWHLLPTLSSQALLWSSWKVRNHPFYHKISIYAAKCSNNLIISIYTSARRFSPEALSFQFTRGLAGWFLQVMMLKGLSYSLGSRDAPILDIVAYGGYTFAGLSVAILTKLVWNYSYYFILSWLCFCMGVFLVNTMKRVLFAEMRVYSNHSNRHHYIFIFIAIAQFPLFFWLGHLKT